MFGFQNIYMFTVPSAEKEPFVYLNKGEYAQDGIWLPVTLDNGFGKFRSSEFLSRRLQLTVPIAERKEFRCYSHVACFNSKQVLKADPFRPIKSGGTQTRSRHLLFNKILLCSVLLNEAPSWQ